MSMRLFDVDIPETDEEKASEFISELQSVNFIGVNMVYLTNYIDAELSIALSHIKEGYKKYVLNGAWSKEKYRDIVYVIARDRQMMIPAVFLRYGTRYDEGKLTREISIERRKYNETEENQFEQEEKKEEKISDEEQELIDYIANHGGR